MIEKLLLAMTVTFSAYLSVESRVYSGPTYPVVQQQTLPSQTVHQVAIRSNYDD
jgi:hypothetical protein